MIITPTEHDAPNEGSDPAELLIKEARRKARWRRLRIGVVFGVTLILAVVLLLLTVGGTPSNSKRAASNKPARTIGANLSSVVAPHFDGPKAIAVSGANVWVANEVGNSITEFNATTGSRVRVIDAKADAFYHPDGISVGGSHVWVSNGSEALGMGSERTAYLAAKYSSVTELNASNGALVRVIDAKRGDFREPGPIAVSGSHVWVLNQNAASSSPSTPGSALVELNANNASVVRIFKIGTDGIYAPTDIAASPADVWVTQVGGPVRSVIELNSDTGSLVRIIRSTKGQLGNPDLIALSGAYAWVAGVYGPDAVVTEVKVSNGSFVRVIKSKEDNLGSGSGYGIAVTGSHVWVTNDGRFDGSLTELNADNGSLVRIIRAEADKFNEPTSIVASDSKLWVLNTNSVTELNADNGSLIRVIK